MYVHIVLFGLNKDFCDSVCTFIYGIDVMKNLTSPKSTIWYDISNFTFQTFVLATAVAGTTVSATNTAAGSQIGKYIY